ncbi:MAG: TfoX/Sxy family protein [Bacteroidales bacterium]|nr:TfoX/Sxy family protein [Bacteroidales bacterium]MBR6776055.1 TfoX/Sxy family protein [Bacteroidales bacterium]
MSCDLDFVNYIIAQCSGAGEITVRKMMGDYCIYCDGIIFGLICDDSLYVKMTDAGHAILKEVTMRPPYKGAKDYFCIADVDDKDYLTSLIKTTIANFPKKKKSCQ